jgi:hypothetical protein
MIPTWMIDDIERQRREWELERERRERPQLRIELPVGLENDLPSTPASSSIIVIELG